MHHRSMTEGKQAILLDKVVSHVVSPLLAPSVPLKYGLFCKI